MNKIDSHQSEMVQRLISQWKEDPGVLAVVATIAEELQELEDLLWFMRQTNVRNAHGKDLDHIGGTVGASRVGVSEEQFRRIVQARIVVNRSRGKVLDLQKIAKILFPEGSVRFIYSPPFSIQIEVAVSDSGWIPEIEKALLEQAADPVTRVDLHFANPGELSLITASGDTFEDGEGRGFSDGDSFDSGQGGLTVGDI
jgi:hypothetical protein